MKTVYTFCAALLLAATLTFSVPARADWLPTVPHGFRVERIATIDQARELAFAPNGDLFVGSSTGDVYIVPHADASAGSPRVFVHLDDTPANGVSFADGSLYVGTQHAIWRVAYRNGDLRARSAPEKLATVRSGSPPAGSDGDIHVTTSVVAGHSRVYASVGSSCNACVETDPTRATIGEVRDGRYTVIAKRIRNAIALAIDPVSGALWAGGPGQDELPPGHPYEFFDDVSAHRLPVDYGWPFCYDNHKRKEGSSESCSGVAVPRVVFPAYDTPVGAVFYPTASHGRYAFPAQYRGGIFVTLHGSWHGPRQGLSGYVAPRVVFVPMRGDEPLHPVNWNDPSAQWSDFAGGYQQGGSPSRAGRPTGVAVGPQGSLFIADDQTGAVYRVRHE